MDESLIYERLKALSADSDRAKFRDISKAFLEVVRYDEKAMEELKNQLDRELRDVSERFYLYGAVMKESDVPLVNHFLFPICGEREEDSAATIFCPCSRREMEEIFSGRQELLLETEEGLEEVSAQIRPCRRYGRRIEQLRKVFYENGVYWRTPYLPYVDRFGDVFCSGIDREKTILSIRFKNRELPVEHDLIPLWNVEPIQLKCTVFPIPAVDEQNYRHTLRLPYAQDGYVAAMDQGIKNVYMSQDGLEVITEEKLHREFELYRIAVKRDIPVPHYGLTTNFRPMRHIDRQSDHSPVRLLTLAELSRIVGSYEAAAGLELSGIEEGGLGGIRAREERYQFEAPGRMAVCLSFRSVEPDFLTEDRISFLLGEVQSYFPQLLVTGTLAAAEKTEPEYGNHRGADRKGAAGDEAVMAGRAGGQEKWVQGT